MLRECADLAEPKRLCLPMTENHRVLQWDEGQVYISYTKRGDAIDMHVASEGRNKRALRDASNMFCNAVFHEFDWCKMVIGVIGSKSVVNLAKKCGFDVIREGEKDGRKITLVARVRK